MVRARNPGAVTRTSWLRQTPTSAGSKVRRYRPDASAKVAEPLPRSWRNAPAMGRPLDSVRTIPSITPVLGPSIRRASSPLQAHRVPPPFSPTGKPAATGPARVAPVCAYGPNRRRASLTMASSRTTVDERPASPVRGRGWGDVAAGASCSGAASVVVGEGDSCPGRETGAAKAGMT
jgi:hypothetical protein